MSHMNVITISTTFGVRGAHIGASLAKTLGIPFVDRAIPRTISRELDLPIEDVMAQDGKATSGLWRILSAMAVIPDVTGTEAAAHHIGSEEAMLTQRTEELMRQTASTTGGVFVGRAGVVVLRDVPGALHVRITGPKEARTAAYAAANKLSLKEAHSVVETNDKARLAYGKTFYRVNLADSTLYHLVIDQTRFTEQATVNLLAGAVRELR